MTLWPSVAAVIPCHGSTVEGRVLTFGAWDRVPHVRETKTNMLSLYMEIAATRGKQVIGESRRQAYGPSRGVQKVDFLYRDLNSECFHRQGQ